MDRYQKGGRYKGMQQILAAILVLALGIMALQHFRYRRIRRDSAQDRQRSMHSTEAFHVITFFRVNSGSKIVDSAKRYKQRVKSISKARLIYAGHATSLVHSEQLGERHWDGLIMFQYPTRKEYEKAAVELSTSAAPEIFADSYSLGMRRNRSVSLAMPQRLLKLRLKNLLTGHWRIEPLRPLPKFSESPEFGRWRDGVTRLRALHAVNRDGLVVFSLLRKGSQREQAAEDSYRSSIFSRMATLDHGPLHIGHPVALEGNARFSSIFVVHYPSAGYFADLLSSQFFHSVIGDHRVGDNCTVPTVPITEKVRS